MRKQGKPSNARRPMKLQECVEVITRLRRKGELTLRYTIAAYFVFQFHMIAHLDDVMHFKVEDLTPNPDYPGTLKSKMCWSKNVLEERESPDQIIIGANDPSFCVILAIAMHVDYAVRSGKINEESTLFGINKGVASDALMKILREEGFPLFDQRPLGTHSIRKFPATYARRNGCFRDDVDIRGRWKSNKRQVDTYIDVELPYPDAKVAGVLAIGGPIKYELKSNSGLTDEWLLQNVGGAIRQIFLEEVALILSKALLWAIFDEDMSSLLDNELVQRVKEQVERVAGRLLATGVNPVRKVPLIISGSDGALIISEFVDYEEQEGGNNSEEENNNDRDDGNRGGGASSRRIIRGGGMNTNNADQSVSDSLAIMTSALNSMRRQNDDMKNQILVLKETNSAMMMQMNASIRRLAMLPVSRVINTSTNVSTSQIIRDENEVYVLDAADNATRGRRGPIAYGSTLCKCPTSLFILWQEYEFGVGGRKPAKNFNAQERGRVKFNYCLRKHFWDLMNSMIRHGYTFNVAIDKIYSVYDRRNSATKILRAIQNDAKNGGNPQLQF